MDLSSIALVVTYLTGLAVLVVGVLGALFWLERQEKKRFAREVDELLNGH